MVTARSTLITGIGVGFCSISKYIIGSGGLNEATSTYSKIAMYINENYTNGWLYNYNYNCFGQSGTSIDNYALFNTGGSGSNGLAINTALTTSTCSSNYAASYVPCTCINGYAIWGTSSSSDKYYAIYET